MRRRSDALRFVSVFLALTVLFGWLFWSVGSSSGSSTLNSSMLAIPVASAMLASVGFTWNRKLVYAGATMGLYLVGAALTEATGLRGVVDQALQTATSFPSVFVVLFVAVQITFPFVMLVLFVGRTPSRLWSRQGE